jgi:hypothetical protein
MYGGVMKMCNSKIKVRKKKKMKLDLMNEIERDGKSGEELRAMMRGVLDFCERKDLQPETLLMELGRIHSVAARVFMKKHQEQIAGSLDRKLTEKEIEDFKRSLDQLQKFGQVELKQRTGGARSTPAERRPAQRNNEDMPYQPSNERPNYIY